MSSPGWRWPRSSASTSAPGLIDGKAPSTLGSAVAGDPLRLPGAISATQASAASDAAASHDPSAVRAVIRAGDAAAGGFGTESGGTVGARDGRAGGDGREH